MPERIEKSVFMSYRCMNFPWALTFYQNLTARGFDVFFGFKSINRCIAHYKKGDYRQAILDCVKAIQIKPDDQEAKSHLKFMRSHKK